MSKSFIVLFCYLSQLTAANYLLSMFICVSMIVGAVFMCQIGVGSAISIVVGHQVVKLFNFKSYSGLFYHDPLVEQVNPKSELESAEEDPFKQIIRHFADQSVTNDLNELKSKATAYSKERLAAIQSLASYERRVEFIIMSKYRAIVKSLKRPVQLIYAANAIAFLSARILPYDAFNQLEGLYRLVVGNEHLVKVEEWLRDVLMDPLSMHEIKRRAKCPYAQQLVGKACIYGAICYVMNRLFSDLSKFQGSLC
jgi:hypothetical protein